METNSDRPEDLNALERRLSAWQPNSEGMDADAVLFAAGRASVSPGLARFIWPTMTALMTVLAVVLGLWLADERSERIALAHRFGEHSPAPVVKPSPPPEAITVPAESSDPDEPPPDSYLITRRALEQGLDAWPSWIVAHREPSDPPITNPPILRVGQRDTLLDP